MTYRIFKHNGQVTDRVDTYMAGASISTDERAAAEVAEALSVDVSTITVEHVEILPAAKVTIPPAQPPAAPTDPQSELLLALAGEWETAAAELKAGRNTTAAEALERAGAVARSAARD